MDSTCVPCPLSQDLTGIQEVHLVAPLMATGLTDCLAFSVSETNTPVPCMPPDDMPRRLAVNTARNAHFVWKRVVADMPTPQSIDDLESAVHDAQMTMAALSWMVSGQWLVKMGTYGDNLVTFYVPHPPLPPSLWPNLAHQCTTYMQRVTVVNLYILTIAPRCVGLVWKTEEDRVLGRSSARRTHTAPMDSQWWTTMDASGIDTHDDGEIMLIADVDDTNVHIHECPRDSPVSMLWPHDFHRIIAR